MTEFRVDSTIEFEILGEHREYWPMYGMYLGRTGRNRVVSFRRNDWEAVYAHPTSEDSRAAAFRACAMEAAKSGVSGVFIGSTSHGWLVGNEDYVEQDSEYRPGSTRTVCSPKVIQGVWGGYLDAMRFGDVVVRGNDLWDLVEWGAPKIIGFSGVMFDESPSWNMMLRCGSVSRLDLCRCSGALSTPIDEGNLGHLKELSIVGMRLGGRRVTEVGSLEVLEELSLADCQGMLEESACQLIDRAIGLSRLDVSGTGWSEDVFSVSVRKGSMRSLSMRNCEGLGRREVQPESNAGNIESLDLANTSIDDEWWARSGTWNGLKSLDLRGTRIGMRSIRVLSTLPKLECVALDGCRGIGDAELDVLMMSTSIRQVAVEDTSVSELKKDEYRKSNGIEFY